MHVGISQAHVGHPVLDPIVIPDIAWFSQAVILWNCASRHILFVHKREMPTQMTEGDQNFLYIYTLYIKGCLFLPHFQHWILVACIPCCFVVATCSTAQGEVDSGQSVERSATTQWRIFSTRRPCWWRHTCIMYANCLRPFICEGPTCDEHCFIPCHHHVQHIRDVEGPTHQTIDCVHQRQHIGRNARGRGVSAYLFDTHRNTHNSELH